MRITLVQPPSNYEETFLLSPPLGLLSIGAAAENEGAHVTLLDFNLKGLQDQRWQTAEYFYPNAVDLVEAQAPDMVGFTSMAIESHVCLELAKQLKKRNPDIITVFGGPHFGAIATEILENYDWCDFVVSGEGETPLQNLIRHIQGNHFAVSMDNIAYRQNQKIVFNKQTRAGRDLDELPFPAYHLVDMEEYFALNPNKLVCFEHARGCYLKCSFCYSPQHWGHGESAKSVERIIRELKALQKEGVKELFWISDNFLNNRSKSRDIADQIAELDFGFKSHCYGTLAQISEEIIRPMSKAGFSTIFVGVDAISEDNKKHYGKTYFKGKENLLNKISICLRNNITPTCAFMFSPYDSSEELREVLSLGAELAKKGCIVRLNALTEYHGSRLYDEQFTNNELNYSEAYSTVLFDTAEILKTNIYAKSLPALYPYHNCKLQPYEHANFAKFCRSAMKLVNTYSLTLSIAEHSYSIKLEEIVAFVANSMKLNELSCQSIGSTESHKSFLESIQFFLAARNIDLPIVAFSELANRTATSNSKNHHLVKYECGLLDIFCVPFIVIQSERNLLKPNFPKLRETSRYIIFSKNGHLFPVNLDLSKANQYNNYERDSVLIALLESGKAPSLEAAGLLSY